MAPFYSILFETSICQFNSSKFSPIMLDEVREQLMRDQKPFLHPEPLQIHSSMTVFLLFSSPHSFSTVFRSQDWNGHIIAEPWFCAQWPIFVLFLRFVFGLLSGWKIQTWPIIIFFLSVGIWYNPWCHVSKQDVEDLQKKYSRTTLKTQQYISLYIWDTFYPCVHQTHLECLLLKS